MRQDLLGYLLGALEPDEMRQVESWLQREPAARIELEQLRAALSPLDETREHDEPSDYQAPAGLFDRTVNFIENADNAKIQPASTPNASLAGELSSQYVSPRASTHRPWRIPDAVVATVSMIVLAALVFPALLDGRHIARRTQCQDNLQRLGHSLAHYAITSPQQRLPEIDLQGPLAFAGMYAVELKARGILQGDNQLWCASYGKPELHLAVPTLEQLRKAGGKELAVLQNLSGGHYAYTLGVMNGKRYQAPHYQSRSTFAVLADSQTTDSDGSLLAHDGRGYNLLFEDGHVVFVTYDALLPSIDPPFVNQDNRIEAGLNVNDASLGDSARAPFVWVKQSN